METKRNQQQILLEKPEYEVKIECLMKYMSEKKPYRDDALTLYKLSKQINVPEKQLSFLLNRVMGRHFFDFINAYRIEEATTLMRNERLNIKQIMYAVGFNSKSSFNTAFKKYTDRTPTAYRADKIKKGLTF